MANFFQACGPQIPKNMFKLVAYILSMPGSNAFPESLFANEHKMER